MEPAVVVEEVVCLDKRSYQESISGILEFVFQELLEAFLVCADLAEGLRMADARMDVVFENSIFQISAEGDDLFRELRPVVQYGLGNNKR